MSALRRTVIVLGLVGFAGVRPASADEAKAGELRARGEELARRGAYAEAIVQLQAADREHPRAVHACMIGLTYLRRSLWPQAEVFLARCERRATASDPAPGWLPDAKAQLAAGLAAADVTLVELRVAPAGIAATVRLSAIPGEDLDPRPLHLAPGKYTLEVAAPGFVSQTRELVIGTGGGNRRVDVELVAERATTVTAVAQPVHPVPRDRPWPARLAVGGGAALAGAIALHVLAVRSADRLGAATSTADYRAHETAFDVQRAGAVSLYGVAAVAGGLALYLRATRRADVLVGASVGGDGAMLTLGWRR